MTGIYLDDAVRTSEEAGTQLPPWARELRQAGREAFGRLGFPTTREEDWKFTSVNTLAKSSFPRSPDSTPSIRGAQLAPALFAEPGWIELVFVNGRYRPELGTGSAPQGVLVTGLRQAMDQGSPLLQRHLGQLARPAAGGFTALNAAYLEDGALVHVPADIALPAPVHLVFVTDRKGEGGSSHPHNLLVLDRGAQAAVVETYLSLEPGAAYFSNAVTEAVVADNARLQHLKIQRESEAAFHVGTTEVRQGRDSVYTSFSFAAGGRLSRTNIYTVMEGEGAECVMNGLYLPHGHQHMDHQTRIEHAVPRCASREVYKGIIDGRAHAVFNGKVFVRPEAQQTDGKQTNKNLLLSDHARVDTKPQLEIFADDVKCTHGATVGRLDALSLFYLESRGIPAPAARRILTYGFAADVIETVSLPGVRDRLDRLVFERLEADAAG